MNSKKLVALAAGTLIGAACALVPRHSPLPAAHAPQALDNPERERLARIVAESAARSAAATARRIAQTQLQAAPQTATPPVRRTPLPSSLALRPTRHPQLQADAGATVTSRPNAR